MGEVVAERSSNKAWDTLDQTIASHPPSACHSLCKRNVFVNQITTETNVVLEERGKVSIIGSYQVHSLGDKESVLTSQ